VRAPLAAGAFALAACTAFAAQADVPRHATWRNVTAGGTLRPGIYGRIVVKGHAAPPPVIYARPVIANSAFVPAHARPVYLYVPPGQVRHWKRNCARWAACDQPVLFVRVEHSPSRWGKWRMLREDIALHEAGGE
jgi:hypothetical protein